MGLASRTHARALDEATDQGAACHESGGPSVPRAHALQLAKGWLARLRRSRSALLEGATERTLTAHEMCHMNLGFIAYTLYIFRGF